MASQQCVTGFKDVKCTFFFPYLNFQEFWKALYKGQVQSFLVKLQSSLDSSNISRDTWLLPKVDIRRKCSFC